MEYNSKEFSRILKEYISGYGDTNPIQTYNDFLLAMLVAESWQHTESQEMQDELFKLILPFILNSAIRNTNTEVKPDEWKTIWPESGNENTDWLADAVYTMYRSGYPDWYGINLN